MGRNEGQPCQIPGLFGNEKAGQQELSTRTSADLELRKFAHSAMLPTLASYTTSKAALSQGCCRWRRDQVLRCWKAVNGPANCTNVVIISLISSNTIYFKTNLYFFVLANHF